MTAPASLNAATAAQSRPPFHPLKRGEPCSVGIFAVSMTSFTPTGMPSINERGFPACHLASDCSASLRALSKSIETNAPTSFSNSSIFSIHFSRKLEGLSDPEVKLERAAAKEQRSRKDCSIENLMDIYFSPSSRNFYKAAYTAEFFSVCYHKNLATNATLF